MPWARRYFKNKKQKVWALVDERGEPVVQNGLVPVRYQRTEGAQVYTVSPKHVGPSAPSSQSPPTDEGTPVAADAASSPSSKKKTKAKAGAKSAPRAEGEPIVSTELPEELVGESLPEGDLIEIYTDGACSGNPGPCSYGVLIRHKWHYKELSQYLGAGTNNIGELTAIKAALEALRRHDLPVHLYTDSSYAIGVLTQGWKAKANKELIASIKHVMEEFENLELCKVKGHAGHPLNERVDALAVEAIRRNTSSS